ncbi:ferritin-like domain-containing protein [Clostridium lundense]|uniref:ferritin-like domain-containing protein n=1 Tax=Clostridium lundense TaxID=319475 RepID=UPI000A930140|nr:ferritin-like domain-containing protein [Clostridium lundense]
MNYTRPYEGWNMCCSNYGTDFTQEGLNKALCLIKDAVQGEKNDELEYDYLICLAPTKEEKEIIKSIRNDERNHNKWYKEIYKCYTGEIIKDSDKEKFDRPRNYIEGIKKAFFGELSAMERYRIIRAGLPNRCQRDIVFQILSDEIKHAIKYNYILTMNLCKNNWKCRTIEEEVSKDEANELLNSINPLVNRALQEESMGMNSEFLFSKFILSGALVGSGKSAEEAMRQVEQWQEDESIGLLSQK